MPEFPDNSEYREPMEEEHETIARFLRKNHFLEDVKKEMGYYTEEKEYIELSKYERKLLLRYLEQVLNGFSAKFETICKNLGYTDKSKSNVSRLTKALNFYLNKFCKEKKVNPSIQFFYYHKNRQGEVKGSFDCHLACAKVGKQENNRRYSYGIVTLKEADKSGRLEGKKASRKTAQKQAISSSSQPEEILELHNRVLTVDKDNKSQNLFRFEYCWPAFVGRDEEMKRLYKFVNCEDKNLLWWIITGNGGTGKSRLALKLCCELKKKGWYAGFLTNTNGPDVWRKWKPERSTLIVVDCNHEEAKEFGEFVGNKYNESKQWKHPVRILFLERYEESETLRRFCYPHPEIIKNNIRYRDKEGDFLELKGLGDRFIDSIITEVFQRYPGKDPSADEVKKIKSFLKKKGHDNRPLYAMFIADACARGKDIRGWDADKLHKSVLQHNKNLWKKAGIDETRDLDKKHINLLTLATMTNGVDVFDDKYDKCLENTHKRLSALAILPAEHEFDRKIYRMLCDYEDEKVIPMIPDILGEYFVLDRWKKSVAQSEMQLLIKIAWEYNFEEMVNFIVRMASDFLADESPKVLLEFANISERSHEERTLLLGLLSINYSGTGKFNKAIECRNLLLDIWEAGCPDDMGLLSLLVFATSSLVLKFSQSKKSDKAKAYYDWLADIWKNRQGEDFIIREMIRTTINMIVSYIGEERPDKAAEHYECLLCIWEADNQKDEIILRALALVTQEMVIYYYNAHKTDRLADCYEYLVKMRDTGFYEDDMILDLLSGTAFYLSYRYTETGELSKAIKYYYFFEELLDSGCQDDQVVAALARIAIVCSYGYEKKGEVCKSNKLRKRFAELHKSFPENEAINEFHDKYLS